MSDFAKFAHMYFKINCQQKCTLPVVIYQFCKIYLYIKFYTFPCIRCFASSTCLRNQRFRKHDSKFEELVTMLSAKGTIHFVYQTLRVFNMLTKSKISEARCSDVEDIVTMLSTAGAIHSYSIYKTNNTPKKTYEQIIFKKEVSS